MLTPLTQILWPAIWAGRATLATPAARLVALLFLAAVLLRAASAVPIEVSLADVHAESYSRWADVADQAYTSSFQAGFHYDNAGTSVTVTFDNVGALFSGTLTARNLKPNFAYQIKLDGGGPESYPTANENLGLAGRWWEQEWNGSTWSGGANLNIQPEVANAANYPDTRSLNDLTEECFHTGNWATVMASDISFTIVPEPSILSLLPLGSSILLVRRARSRRS
jgi:hypothetical protein